MSQGNCVHEVWIDGGVVYLANTDDAHYVQEFKSTKELDSFIRDLIVARSDCFKDEAKVFLETEED